jgi:predicted MFS family arabinose efflux permease
MLWLSATTAATASIAIGLFARSATQLVGLLMIAGVSNGVAGPTASALLRATIPPDRHGLAFGTQQAGAPCSVLLAGLAVPGIAVPFGWRWAFVGVAAIAVLAAAAAPPLSREESRPMTRARVRGTLAESRATLAVIVLAAAVASAVGVAVVSFLVVFASQAGFSQSAAGLLLGCVSLLAMVGRIGFGLHADHAGTDPLVAALPLFLACTVGVTLLIAGTPIAIVSGALIIGALGWTWHGVITLAVVKRTEDAPVWAVGVLMSGVFAGAIVGPLLVGTLAHQLSFRAAWSVCAALSLVPLAAVGLARRRRPLRPPMNPEADALTVRRHYPAGREDCASECGRSPDAC